MIFVIFGFSNIDAYAVDGTSSTEVGIYFFALEVDNGKLTIGDTKSDVNLSFDDVYRKFRHGRNGFCRTQKK